LVIDASPIGSTLFSGLPFTYPYRFQLCGLAGFAAAVPAFGAHEK
jgi:hypothetical protein